MIDYLRGRLVAAYPGRVIIEVGGVALATEIPASSFEKLTRRVGEEITLYTKLVLKEDEARLYGFCSPGERNLFNLVTGVSGFGPRLALALVGSFSTSQFCIAVLEENIALLCQAPGVGRKGAQRLVLELKEKLAGIMAPDVAELTAVSSAETLSLVDEITEALCALGYSRVEALAAVGSMPAEQSGLSREEMLKLALKRTAAR